MILLDTHIVVWLISSPKLLSKKAATAIAEARQNDGGVAVSCITLYELACAASKGRLTLAMSIDALLEEVAAHFAIKPITSGVALAAVRMPANYPKDPMDRIIGATALSEGLTLVTADRAIRDSKAVPVIW